MRDVEQRDSEIERLRLIVKQLQRSQFGRSSERLDPSQIALGLKDLGADLRIEERKQVTKSDAVKTRARGKPLPEHLPRDNVVLDVGGETCGGCGGALHSIGESVSEMLDWFRRSCAWSGFAAPNTPVAPAGLWCKRLHRIDRLPEDWRRRRCSPRCLSASIVITCRSIGRGKSSPVMGSGWSARRSPAGLVGVLVARSAARSAA